MSDLADRLRARASELYGDAANDGQRALLHVWSATPSPFNGQAVKAATRAAVHLANLALDLREAADALDNCEQAHTVSWPSVWTPQIVSSPCCHDMVNDCPCGANAHCRKCGFGHGCAPHSCGGQWPQATTIGGQR